ncbi:ABC-2 type transport system permease protein [Fontibacillus phaseoli]|uniref:ABC-2 type transport system permease protein n=1 Tax=Fontibacillus phaseoli TaxID=1416533 RepID=A0A369BEN0_9BACL|nr:ABC transporter permease [Fontibacillus phaseoli]RCX19725.1 ABC-2 type transport system permease protein [Fontibacillus phaseoli]
MKLAASVIKTFKENIRDWKVLAMVLLFAPFFLLIMYLLYGRGATTYDLGILNLDEGNASTALIEMIDRKKGPDGSKLFNISHIATVDELEGRVKEKVIDIGMVLPPDYSTLPSVAHLYGSMNNVRYPVAAVMVADEVQKQGMAAAKITLPITISETFLERQLPMNEFDGYVPGLLTLAILMILFTATASIVKENDKKTLIRLKLSRLGAFHFLAAICIVQAFIAVGAMMLSYWTALGLGYSPSGNFGTVLLVGVLSSLSMVSISLVVASFLRTVFDVLTVGCFPFFILMFFSGSMFPLPKLPLFSIQGHSLGITDILPLTHTVNAFNKVLNYGAGWNEIKFDLFMILILTLVYFLAGLGLYQRRRLSWG